LFAEPYPGPTGSGSSGSVQVLNRVHHYLSACGGYVLNSTLNNCLASMRSLLLQHGPSSLPPRAVPPLLLVPLLLLLLHSCPPAVGPYVSFLVLPAVAAWSAVGVVAAWAVLALPLYGLPSCSCLPLLTPAAIALGPPTVATHCLGLPLPPLPPPLLLGGRPLSRPPHHRQPL
jgi:hypothetical protein